MTEPWTIGTVDDAAIYTLIGGQQGLPERLPERMIDRPLAGLPSPSNDLA